VLQHRRHIFMKVEYSARHAVVQASCYKVQQANRKRTHLDSRNSKYDRPMAHLVCIKGYIVTPIAIDCFVVLENI
jgi:hypothetical protein